jgi:N6-L-threonylcarbamoyladenine synthase
METRKKTTILGIETSCDDTGISIIRTNNKDIEVLADCVSSQETIHSPYGGVFPALAKREHQRIIIPLLEKSLKKAGLLENNTEGIDNKVAKRLKKVIEKNPQLLEQCLVFLSKYKKPKIDRIAITTGPGLEPCLWVGVNLAKALNIAWDIPLVAVNHLEGHLISNFIGQSPKISFPAIGLIVSGGNTQIVLMKELGRYKIVGETRDDAAGECFDKTARLLGLGYPGGKKVSELAKRHKDDHYGINLPRPMIHEKNLDFSFSGLKTAVLYETKKRDKSVLESDDYRVEISKRIEEAIVEVLSKKMAKAIDAYKANSIVVGGGVSANKELRKALKNLAKEKSIPISFPKTKHTGDNACMIALSTIISPSKKTTDWKKIKPNSNMRING